MLSLAEKFALNSRRQVPLWEVLLPVTLLHEKWGAGVEEDKREALTLSQILPKWCFWMSLFHPYYDGLGDFATGFSSATWRPSHLEGQLDPLHPTCPVSAKGQKTFRSRDNH